MWPKYWHRHSRGLFPLSDLPSKSCHKNKRLKSIRENSVDQVSCIDVQLFDRKFPVRHRLCYRRQFLMMFVFVSRFFGRKLIEFISVTLIAKLCGNSAGCAIIQRYWGWRFNTYSHLQWLQVSLKLYLSMVSSLSTSNKWTLMLRMQNMRIRFQLRYSHPLNFAQQIKTIQSTVSLEKSS